MGDSISAWKQISRPWEKYLGQFTRSMDDLNYLDYYPGSTVADITPEMYQGLKSQRIAGQTAQDTGFRLQEYGGRQMYQGRPEVQNQMMNRGRFGTDAMFNTGTAAGAYGQAAARALGGSAGDPGSLRRRQLNPELFASISNNPHLEGQIDAVSKDIMRNTYENEIPGLASSAVGAGSSYSTRAQHSYDLAMRQGREAVGDVAAQMRYQNLNDARQQTLQVQLANQQTELARRGLAQQGMATGYGYGLQGLQQQLEAQRAGTAAGYAGAAQYGQIGQAGVQNMLAGSNQYRSGSDLMMDRGNWLQGYAQKKLNDEVARHQFEQMSPFLSMQAYTQALSPPAGMPFSYGGKGGGGTAMASALPGIMMGAASIYDIYSGQPVTSPSGYRQTG